MRTTLTLEDDLGHRLQDEARRSGRSFKETVNSALRRGLDAAQAPPLARFQVEARDLGLKPGFSYDDVWDLVETLDGPLYR